MIPTTGKNSSIHTHTHTCTHVCMHTHTHRVKEKKKMLQQSTLWGGLRNPLIESHMHDVLTTQVSNTE